MSDKNKKILIGCIVAAILLAVIPLVLSPSAEFGGSDDAGSEIVAEMDEGYTPWFEPLIETAIGGELPGELESLLFCVQTGIGVAILFYYIGRFVERKKYPSENQTV